MDRTLTQALESGQKWLIYRMHGRVQGRWHRQFREKKKKKKKAYYMPTNSSFEKFFILKGNKCQLYAFLAPVSFFYSSG
ncbi:hypothetical protein MXE40_09370 [Anaerobiospirillum sp. NML02-A-032]|uniref:hypothetical protein n=1 Tax=Anaerobiospirillum sp. NML02-A-032 TaxID=2932818 RepID=UPI001FF44B10|nr:hypothetical protein [Anaerobiospirillum sp. NML02-A-032]MCK0540698.1 hypothetical protein [Anaerobiospirillum sp. NML02-A-032]